MSSWDASEGGNMSTSHDRQKVAHTPQTEDVATIALNFLEL
jgi:hypothetical protein